MAAIRMPDDATRMEITCKIKVKLKAKRLVVNVCQCVPWISLQLPKTIWFNSLYIRAWAKKLLASFRVQGYSFSSVDKKQLVLSYFLFFWHLRPAREVPRLLRTITVFTESTRRFSIVGDKRNCSVEHEGVDGRSEAAKRSVLKKKTWVESSGNGGGS